MHYTIKIGKEINTNDVNCILDLIGWESYSSDLWTEVINKSTFMVQVLTKDKTIGFARTLDDGRMCMIYDVCVHPDYQRSGIGTLLMQEILKYIHSHHFYSVSLFYDMSNMGVDNFYRKFGFELIPNAMRLTK